MLHDFLLHDIVITQTLRFLIDIKVSIGLVVLNYIADCLIYDCFGVLWGCLRFDVAWVGLWFGVLF